MERVWAIRVAMERLSDVIRLAARGDGVTADGRYVAGALPGDRVADDGAIVPGQGHQTPPCRHFPECGGCQLQHADDATYCAFAVDRILRPLNAVGVEPKLVEPVALSPPRSRRRATLWAQQGSGGEAAIGFYAEGSRRLVPMTECHILAPVLFALVSPLRRFLAPLIRPGQTVGVTMTSCDGGVDLLLANVQAESQRALAALTSFAIEHGLARLCVEGPGGVDTIVDQGARVTLGGVPVALPPAGFLQATQQGERALVAAVLAGCAGARKVADLFAGAGTFALPLARSGINVLAVDAAGPSLKALDGAARQAKLAVRTDHRDLFRRPLTASELDSFDAVVIDPPRAGAARQTEELAKSRVPVVMTVSCNPATFARDAERLAGGGYTMERLWPVAQFRWSTHIELAALWRR